MTPASPNPELCACGGKVAHVVIDGIVELDRMCDSCFEQHLRDRFAAGLPVAAGWARRLGLRGTTCAACGNCIPKTGCFIGGRAVCNPDCGRELLAKLPRSPARTFPPTGEVVQLPLMMTFKSGKEVV